MKSSFFSLKMMVKSGLEFILKFTEPLQRYLLSCQANSANFKTRNFSPLIKRVLAGVITYNGYNSTTHFWKLTFIHSTIYILLYYLIYPKWNAKMNTHLVFNCIEKSLNLKDMMSLIFLTPCNLQFLTI